MRIEYTQNGGFIEIIESGIVEKVVCCDDGFCTIYFYNRPPKTLKINHSVYNRQYGIPISEDGSKLFVGSWEKGLFAYDIMLGTVLWQLNSSKITSIIVYSTYVIAQKYGSSIFKLDINSGKILAEIKSGTIEMQFDLGKPYILVNSIKGKLSVIDTEQMLIAKKYSSKVVNPSSALSFVIQSACIKGRDLVISGVEGGTYNPLNGLTNSQPFFRVIDTDFMTAIE